MERANKRERLKRLYTERGRETAGVLQSSFHASMFLFLHFAYFSVAIGIVRGYISIS